MILFDIFNSLVSHHCTLPVLVPNIESFHCCFEKGLPHILTVEIGYGAVCQHPQSDISRICHLLCIVQLRLDAVSQSLHF
jgi:hypothetical protein